MITCVYIYSYIEKADIIVDYDKEIGIMYDRQKREERFGMIQIDNSIL